MDTENKDQDGALQQSRKKGALKKLSKVGKAIRKRLPKTPKSERALGSLTGSESGATATKRQNSLTSRLKKRFSYTPRRSMSVTDLDSLGATEKDEEDGFEEDNEITPMTQSVTRTEDSIEEETKTETRAVSEFESVSYPSTPVPTLRERQTMMGTSANSESFERQTHYERSTNEFSAEIERRTYDSLRPFRSNEGVLTEQLDEEETVEQGTSDPLGSGQTHDYFEQGVEIIQYSSIPGRKDDETMLDAAPAIDLGIEEAVSESLDQVKLVAAVNTVPQEEEEIVEQGTSDPLGDGQTHDYFEQAVDIIDYSSLPGRKDDEATLDAAVTIDVGIEETVAESLDQTTLAADVNQVPQEEEEIVEQETSDPLGGEQIHDYCEQAVEIIDYSSLPGRKDDEATLDAAVTIDLGIEETVAESLDQTTLAADVNPAAPQKEEEEPAREALRVTPREMDPSLIDTTAIRPRELELRSEITPEPEEGETSKAVSKPRRRRFRRFLLREAPISLATLAVGLLFIVLKARAK